MSKLDKEVALLEAQIRELEGELMDMCFQRNVAESKNAQMIGNFKMFKKQGLVDDDLDLERGIV